MNKTFGLWDMSMAIVFATLIGVALGSYYTRASFDDYNVFPKHVILEIPEARCNRHMQEPENQIEMLQEAMHFYPYSWYSNNNSDCVYIRQQVLNQILVNKLAVDGVYSNDMLLAERKIALQIGVTDMPVDMYPRIVEQLTEKKP